MFAEVQWTQGITDAWSQVAQTIPKLLYFALVLIVGLIVARALGRMARKVLLRVGADGFAQRVGIAPHLERAGFTLSALGGRAVKLFVTFVAVTTAFAVFGPDNPVSRLLDRFVAYVPNVFVAAVIIAITAAVARWVGSTVTRLSNVSEGATRSNVPDQLPMFATAAVWVVGAFAALDQLRIAPAIVHGVFYAALAAMVGIAVVAIGGGGIAPMRGQWERTFAKRGVGIDLRDAATDDHDTATNASGTLPPPVSR